MPRPDTAGWVLVAGATGRIGAETAEVLAARGTDLVVHGSRREAAEKLANGLAERHGVRAVAVAADITDGTALAALRGELEAHGVTALAALVNCVTGYRGAPVPLAQLPEAELRHVIDVDLVGAFLLTQQLLPLLTARPGAKVVLFSSVAGLRGRFGAAHLCAAKAGVQGLVLALVNELRAHGVSVNTVAPGPVEHAGGQTVQLPPGVAFSTARQVAEVAAYLASEHSSPLQGQTLVVNGGLP
jgi:3-oxoacyl-[acyl-carrier protein] reductase